MSEPGGERRGREDAGWQRATFLELFFDLVFVFALSQVSIRLINDFNTGHELVFSEAAPTVLMFLALWILWLSMVALTSRLHPDSPPAQLMVFASMACAVVMAVAVGRGFEQRAVIFAGAYAAARTSRALLVLAFRLTHQIPVPVLLSLVASSVPWIVGALVNTPLIRGSLWALALVLDYGAFTLGYPRLVDVPIAGEHLAERLQQFYLITLGEAILVSGRALNGSNFRLPHGAGFGLALLSVVLFWRIYFYQAGFTLPVAITRAGNPIRVSVAVTGSHLLMIAGVVLTGAGFELYITEPLRRPEPNWLIAILGGPALFLAGRSLFELQVFARVSRARPTGLFALGLLIPATWYLPPLADGTAAAVILAGVAGSDAWRDRGRELEPPAPRT